jgi:hypothetical protein
LRDKKLARNAEAKALKAEEGNNGAKAVSEAERSLFGSYNYAYAASLPISSWEQDRKTAQNEAQVAL